MDYFDRQRFIRMSNDFFFKKIDYSKNCFDRFFFLYSHSLKVFLQAFCHGRHFVQQALCPVGIMSSRRFVTVGIMSCRRFVSRRFVQQAFCQQAFCQQAFCPNTLAEEFTKKLEIWISILQRVSCCIAFWMLDYNKIKPTQNLSFAEFSTDTYFVPDSLKTCVEKEFLQLSRLPKSSPKENID